MNQYVNNPTFHCHQNSSWHSTHPLIQDLNVEGNDDRDRMGMMSKKSTNSPLAAVVVDRSSLISFCHSAAGHDVNPFFFVCLRGWAAIV